MARATYKEIDQQGRISVPSRWRNKLKTKKVLVVERDERLEVIPLDEKPLTAYFDTILVDDDTDFTDPHDLKRAALEKP